MYIILYYIYYIYVYKRYLFIYLFIYLVFNSSSTCQHPPDIITGAAV